MANSLYWHDYETFGTDPRRDRAVQFAGIRTDEALNIIGEPLMVFARPADDFLPQPMACLVTGITPQRVLKEGIPEAEFIARIHAELAQPGTCGVGYNSIRFDDEFTRYTLYRNLFDPYGREWQNGNSRWDIIDMVRAAHDLRPEGIHWPKNEQGRSSFRLEVLTAANGIGHEQAHDALSDVHATIALAKLIKEKQPRLYDFLYQLRSKHEVARLLDLKGMTPVLHTSGMYSSGHGCSTLIAPLAAHPSNANAVIAYDLRKDPTPLLSLDADTLRERLYTPTDQLPADVERIPLKLIHRNKCPVVAPMKTLDEAAAERLAIDTQACLQHHQVLVQAQGLVSKVREIYQQKPFEPDTDPDHNLYGGGFFSDSDRRTMDEVRACTPAEIARHSWHFEDGRLPEMLFRYRARNWPDTLNADEREAWEAYRRERLTQADAGASITLEPYRNEIEALLAAEDTRAEDKRILQSLMDYGDALLK